VGQQKIGIEEMGATLNAVTKLVFLIGSLVLFYFLVVFVSSVVQIAEVADRMYLGLGQPVFIGLILILVVLVLIPFYIYFRFPKALVPTNEDSGPEYDKFMSNLRTRLRQNKSLKDIALDSDNDVRAALACLSGEADQIIQKTAGAVFVGTAVMQNGRLDGLISLASQMQMVWNIACVYQQRPSPRQMMYLYSNVAATALLAESIEDIDMYEIISPMLTSAGFSTLSAVPGTSIIVNSLTHGASNAFLTLRVGCITKQYCEALSTPTKSRVRRVATLEAAGMIGGIVKDNSKQLMNALKRIAIEGAKAVTGKVSNAVVQGTQTVSNAAGATVDGIKNFSVEAADSAVLGAKKISEVVIQGSQSVFNVAEAGYDGVMDASAKVTDVAIRESKNAVKSVGSVAQSVKDGVNSSIESTSQFVKDFGTRKD
jgi:hypothetical protein